MVRVVLFLLGLGLYAAWPVSAGADTLHDPMRPEAAGTGRSRHATVKPVQTKEPKWKLTAVIISVDRKVAVLNGRTLQRGDWISGYRVQAIEANRVLLVKRGRTKVVPRVGTGLRKVVTNRLDTREGSQE